MARITINGVSLDPLEQADALRAEGLESVDASESNYILIQTGAPLTRDEKAQLADLGVAIHEYVPESTYLCSYPGTDLDAIRALPFVLWADVYYRAFKIAPSLRSAGREASAAVLATAEAGPPFRAPRQVDVVLHDDVDPGSEAVQSKIAAAARLDADHLQTGSRKVRLMVQEDQLDELATVDEVRHIEEVPERQLFNNVARPILNAEIVANGTSYRGDGETIAVADTGFDLGSTTDVHPAFSGRVSRLYALGRTNPESASDPHGHGTHVAGSALGDGTSSSMGGAVQGTAPEARLVLQSMLDGSGKLRGIPRDLHNLFGPPYDDDGARVHTNSWGAVTPGLPYDESAREIDDVVWNRPDLVICFAAGNDGIDLDQDGIVDAESIGSQSSAKNCITVGASESSRPNYLRSYGGIWPDDFPANPINSDLQANDVDGLVAFSSRGPSQEGRIKPDVVAPGTCILSTLSRAVASPSTLFGTSSDSLFFFSSGTSMAAPLVAGCAAVLRETIVKGWNSNPSAALIKALLINGAIELPGQYAPTEAGPSPNNNSGFGRVDLAGSVITPGRTDAGFGDQGGPLTEEEEGSFPVDIPDGATFKITLVWSDPPGAALQNDLDLIVRAANGEERHGNVGTAPAFDRVNNVEQVVWEDMRPGTAQVVVRAFRITALAQPYAYVWRID